MGNGGLSQVIVPIEAPFRDDAPSALGIPIGDAVYEDLAWAYDFPTRQLLPIAGLVAFYSEKVDVFLDGAELERPVTHFFNT